MSDITLIQDLITLGKIAYKERHMLKDRVVVGTSKRKSISAIANDATYFFQVIASENLSPDELIMIMRAVERSYAVFTRTAFMLIPAVEVDSFNEATIKDYLDQFHHNMGVRQDISLEFKLESDAGRFNNSIINEETTVSLKNRNHTLTEDIEYHDQLRYGGDEKVVKDEKEFNDKGKVVKHKMATGDVEEIEYNDTTGKRVKSKVTGKPEVINERLEYDRRSVYSDIDWKKANDMLPSVVQVPVKFISRDTKATHIVDIIVNIKAVMHRTTSAALVRNIVNALTQKKSLLNFVKFVSGEEKSIADFLFGISQMKADLVGKANPWLEAFKRRKRLADIAWGTLKNNFMPIGTICLTMNEVNTLKQKYDIDVFKDSTKIMNEYFLLGLIVADQSNEILYVRFDSHSDFQEYPYRTLEREAGSQDRTIKDMIRAMGAYR